MIPKTPATTPIEVFTKMSPLKFLRENWSIVPFRPQRENMMRQAKNFRRRSLSPNIITEGASFGS